MLIWSIFAGLVRFMELYWYFILNYFKFDALWNHLVYHCDCHLTGGSFSSQRCTAIIVWLNVWGVRLKPYIYLMVGILPDIFLRGKNFHIIMKVWCICEDPLKYPSSACLSCLDNGPLLLAGMQLWHSKVSRRLTY